MTIFDPTGPNNPGQNRKDSTSPSAKLSQLEFGPYSDFDIKEIQALISRDCPPVTDREALAIGEAFAGLTVINHLVAFAPLAARNPPLFEKLAKDERVKVGSMFCFFPESLPLFYASGDPVTVRADSGTRGMTAILESQSRTIVIKPHQSDGEAEIARQAAELGVGPRQLPSLPGFITEDFVAGPSFSRLRNIEVAPEKMYEYGLAYGEMLKKLHEHNLYYNDQALCDDNGKSHLILPNNGKPVLIDFGRALNLSDFGALSDAQVYNFMDTLPKTFLLRMMYGQLNPAQLVNDGREVLSQISKEDLLAEDVRAVGIGLIFARDRIGERRCQVFEQGFTSSYQEANAIWATQRPAALQQWAGVF